MKPTSIVNVASEIETVPDSTVSKTLFQDERVRVVLFAFDAGQELSEHTAAVPAVVHLLEGEARITLGEEVFEARTGSWIHMPARLPHSVSAKSRVKMMLLLLRGGTS